MAGDERDDTGNQSTNDTINEPINAAINETCNDTRAIDPEEIIWCPAKNLMTATAFGKNTVVPTTAFVEELGAFKSDLVNAVYCGSIFIIQRIQALPLHDSTRFNPWFMEANAPKLRELRSQWKPIYDDGIQQLDARTSESELQRMLIDVVRDILVVKTLAALGSGEQPSG